MKIDRLFIANRGEIALRVARTCRRLGIASIAAHARGEDQALHVQACDEAIELPGDGVAAYLDVDAVVAAARGAGADAVHPGYGFLAENADFAAACAASGLVFIGPGPESIRTLGDKEAAKRLARRHGIPTLDSVAETDPDDAAFTASATSIGFPLLIKPLAGGGGKGMVTVGSPADLPEAVRRARHEAAAAFGDERLLAEPLLEDCRHIEVQIAGDQHGTVRHLFERDCSLQRRHQKIVEETPAPRLDSGTRRQLFAAAEKIAAAARYENLGTVEFLVGADGGFHFLEMNTRLQVEHPVTEMVTGLDLVEIQIGIAAGGSLDTLMPAPATRGHAVEARLYAEDPEGGFLPATGTIRLLELPQGDGIRVDAGIAAGSKVDTSFDPLLLKLIVHAGTRRAAIRKLDEALARLVLLGLNTNGNFLRWVTSTSEFVEATHHTRWVESQVDRYRGWESGQDAAAALAVMRAAETDEQRRSAVTDDDEPWLDDPYLTLGGWRIGARR